MHLLLVALAAVSVGVVLGFVAAEKYRLANRHTGLALFLLIAAAIIAALIPNVGQTLYDLGLSFPQIELLQAVSYFVFGFTITASWVLLVQSRIRWLLVALIPVSFAQPALWAYAFVIWGIYGFAP